MQNPSNTTHTPAPWNRSAGVISSKRGVIAIFNDYGFYNTSWCEHNEQQANARLIQLAPDMFEALKGLLAVCDPELPAAEHARYVLERAGG